MPSEDGWPRGVTPEEALVRIARAKGPEGEALLEVNFDGSFSIRDQWPQRKVLEGELFEMLRSGQLIATGCRKKLHERRFEVNPESWNFLTIHFGQNIACESILGQKDQDFRGESLGATNCRGIHCRYLLIHRPPPDERARVVSASKANASRKCRAWLKARAADTQPWTKDNAWHAVQVAIPGLSQRQFLTAWDAEAPPEWRRPGRKSKRANRDAVSKHQKS